MQKKKNEVFVSQNILRGQIVDEKQFSSRQQEKKQEIFCKLQNCKIQININWGLEFSFEVGKLVRFLQKKINLGMHLIAGWNFNLLRPIKDPTV